MKHINLTQMLQGCSKRNGMTVSASNPDGELTENRQSRLMSLSGKKAEKEQLSPSCLLSASFPLSFRSRYLRYAAMIFCVLAMNVGQMWGATKATWTSASQSSLPTSMDAGKVTLAWSENSSSTQTSTIYGSGASAVARFFSDGSTLTIGSTSSYKIDSIIITISGKSNSPVGFKTGGATTGWSSFTTSGANKYTVASPSAGASYEITIYKTSGTLTNGRIDISQIDVYYEAVVVKDYTVTAESNNDSYGTVEADDSSLDAGETTTITATPADGYRVSNWAVDGTGASISPSGDSHSTTTTLTMGTANATVTCTFEAIPTYTISYDKGANGTGTISSGTKYDGVAFTLSTEHFTRAGYAQTGWSLTDGGAKAYSLGGSYTTDAAQTFYPYWEATTSYTFDCEDEKSISTLEGEGWIFNSKTFDADPADGEAYANLVSAMYTAGLTAPNTNSMPDYALAIAKNSSAYAEYVFSEPTTVSGLTATIAVGSGNARTIDIIYLNSSGSELKKISTAHSKKNWGDNSISNTSVVENVKRIRIKCAYDGSSYSWTIIKTLGITYVSAGCTVPTGLTNGTTTAYRQDVSWTAGGSESAWEVYVSTSSSTPAADATPTATPTSATYTFRSLDAGTTYYWWVRAKCDVDDYSDWVAGTSFTTSSSARTFKSGEIVYFKDEWNDKGNASNWKIDGNELCAYFWNDTEGAWKKCVAFESGSWNTKNTIYKIIVPGSGKVYDHVLFSRGGDKESNGSATIDNQTHDQSPSIGYNIFYVNNTATDGKYGGTWGRYAHDPALIGDFNDWDPDANVFTDFSSNVGDAYFTLAEEETYGFKVLEGATYYSYDNSKAGWTLTNTNTTTQQFYNNNNNSNITSTEAGEYMMKYNKSTHSFVAVYYPKERLARGTIVYFDARNETNWYSANFDARYGWQYFDSGSEQSWTIKAKGTALENWVYYAVVPNNKTIGRIEMKRLNPADNNTVWCTANAALASSRTSVLQNCLKEEKNKENYCDSWTPQWTTYCPPTDDVTLSDNSTTVITGTSGNGSKATPYLVVTGGTINVTASADQLVDDDNMTQKFDFEVNKSSQQDGTGSTYSHSASTNNTVYKVTVKSYNYYNSTSGTKVTSDTLYYKALNTYNITYYKGANGTGTEYTDLKIYGVDKSLRGAIFTRTGYTQTGWATEDGGSKEHNLSADYTGNTDLELYPVWTAKTTTVTLDPNTANNGTGSSVEVTATYDAALSSFDAAVPATGYHLTGYFTDATGGTKVIDADGTFSANSGVWNREDGATLTLYAQYEINTYTVTFASNNGSYGSVSPTSVASVPHGSEVGISSNVLTLKGTDVTASATTSTAAYTYAFSSWSVSDGDAITSAQTITATFTRTANSYDVTLSYDDDEVSKKTGSTGTDAATYGTDYVATFQAKSGFTLQSDVTVTIGESTATKGTEYTWSVSEGVGTLTVGGSYITDDIEVAVDADADETYTVTYKFNDGATDDDTDSGTSVTLPTPTWSGYTLQGWYASDSTKAGDGGDTYNPTGDITLYALWREDCAGSGTKTLVDINFKSSDWTDKTFSQGNTNDEDVINGVYFWSKHSDKQFSLASNTSNGLTFPNNNMSSGNDYFCIPITGINASDKEITVTLKHGYSSSKASFKYVYVDGRTSFVDANTNGSGGTQVQDAANADTEISFTKSSLSNTSGHLMIGRYGSDYTKIYGVTVTTPASATCYYVTYNGNGATGGFTMDETAHGSGDNVAVLSNSYTKTGYTFTGWNTKADGKGTAYSAGGTISSISGNITLYAQWSSGTKYSVTYNGNDATDGSAPIDASSPYASGANVTVLGNTGSLEKTNYTFDGWNTANDGSGTSYAADGTLSSIAANVTLYAKWKQTVTLKTGSQGSGDDKTPYIYWNGTELSSDAVHSVSGYTLNGYYTASSGGTKVLNADGTLVSNVTGYTSSTGTWVRTGSTTLYAQWRAAAGKTCYTWDAAETHPQTGTTSYDGLYLTGTPAKKQANSSLNDTIYDVSNGSKCLTGHIGGTVIDSIIFAASTSNSDNNTFVIAFCSTQTFDTAKIIKVDGYQCVAYTVPLNTAAGSQVKVKAPAGTKSFILGRNYSETLTCATSLKNKKERYLYYVRVCSASGGTHTISYNNGGGTGTMSSNTGITDDGSQALTSNSFTAPTNFAFAGWVADVDVTIGGDTKTAGTLIANGATITNILSDIALTAKWSQTITLDDNDANHGTTGDGSATVYYNATSLASITHTTAASGYKLAGYYTAATSGTKVLNSDGSFAGDDITDWIDDGKWVQNDDDEPLLYAQYEVAGSIKWNLQVNSADAPIVTSSKNSSYTQISTSNMTNLDSIGLNITASKKGGMTSKITAPTAFDKDKYMKVTFQVASGYQFKPSSIKVPIQPVDGGADVKLVLVDNAATPDSIGKVQSSLSKGTLTTVEMTNSSAVFKGTVTLKIYCYGSSTGTYRLGTPIQIDGEIESTCTMPSYTSVSYSQTEYVQPASASAISVVGASGDPSYQWKYNSTGDRTSGTNCGTEASVTPSTESTGTLYYWCELTNACGTVKTPAVAITVSASKSTATVTWTDPSTPNYGGGGYTIKATVNEAWDGNASDLIITAPAGIRIYDKTSGTDGSGKKYVQVKFDVQTALDRSTYEDKIPFTVSADATATYNAISADHNVSYSACSGGGGSATEELMPVDDSHMDNSTWKGGWVYDGIGMMRYGHGSSDVAPGTKNANLVELTYKMADDDVDTYYKSSANHFGFYTEKAITGIRLYVHTTNDEVTVSGVYVANSAYSTGTPSTGSVSFTAEYNDDNESLRSGTHSGSAWVDITFASEVAAGKYGQINLSSNVRIAGMAFISASGSGATLTTTLAFASSSVTKAQSDANFTITPTKGDYSETLGAITYSSSNTDCATVNATTGEVTITATGSSNLTSRITATLAASGCYKSATAYYDLTVTGQECTITSAGTLSADKTVKCSSANVTLTLSGEDDGMTVTWYRDATEVTGSVLDHTLITSAAGSYSVVVSNATCSKRSNSITISNYSAEVAATKIVDKWYIKHGRVTPDIALWALDEGTHLDSVTWSTTNATGLTIADFYESDGVVYLSGKEPNTNESSDVEYTLTLRVKDECENKTLLNTSDKQITLTHQKNTDKHVLAFVVTGTEKGGWTAGISADQTTNVELYNEIAKTFDVQATNIYSTDDEQKLKEYYSQFDILCITDYPNTGKTGTNKKSYVDAIGSLIDIRPILTMEAFVSKLDNWKSKGISGTPKSPTTRQYSMLLQCKDHEIFSGTNPTTVGSGDETMYRIDMVDKTMEEYATLDATYGAGAHVEKSGYEYGSKPALQGFTYDASMSSLLPIGRIDDGAGNDLEVGVERQAVMEARLLVLGINGYAMERLDDDGVTIVINALKYLMKKNAEDISDCSNYFVGGAEGDPYSWKNLDNWSGSSLPDRTQEVRIVAPCVISDTIARASSVKIVTGGTYSHGTKTANGSLTINPTGSLIVEGKIYAATAPNFFEQRATEPEDLVVKADDSYTGTLIFDNEDGETQATIEMYSKSYWETVEGKYKKYWSYVGMPIKDVHIPDYFYGAFTYYYNETKGWERRFDNDIMQPFEGIGLSMQTGHKETFYGTMVSTENVDIKLTSTTGYGDGDNLIGNSWTAPIQIANFDASDFGDALATIYIFNTGREGNTYVDATVENKGVAKDGQWLGVPISVAGLEEYTGLKVVPAMNAFLVYNDEGAGTTTTMHLDYEKLVRDGASSNTQINEPMRAPSAKSKKKKDVEGLLRIRVVGEKTNTDVWMMQDPRFSEAFDNGWEAYYTTCDDRSAQLYARSSTGKMSFLALPDLDGTVLGFAPSRDGNNYTFTFQYRGEDEYYLNDLKLQQSVLINADNTYDFIYEKGDTNRFYVSRTPLQAPQTPTGIGNTEGTSTQSVKAIKVIYNDKLYIIRGGRVYSADGSLVK